eukprot:10252670-Karenia_brevis.AAC.1
MCPQAQNQAALSLKSRKRHVHHLKKLPSTSTDPVALLKLITSAMAVLHRTAEMAALKLITRCTLTAGLSR